MFENILDENVKKSIEKAGKNLQKNNMQVFFANKKSDVCEIIQKILSDKDVVSSGGSMSLKDAGVIDLLRSGRYNYLDREGKSDEETQQIYRETFSADAYFCSSNAVTENGELYNVDGNANRISAISFGPKSVIMVVGFNKIVPTLDDAILRVKNFVAPENCKRLGCETFCKEAGKCVKSANSDMCGGCDSDARICCSYLVCSRQRIKNRIKIIIVGEKLGY
ncbi:MAG: lactate utilization protein [Oscillospiraceae bacterium]